MPSADQSVGAAVPLITLTSDFGEAIGFSATAAWI